jgi:hypothetical protein
MSRPRFAPPQRHRIPKTWHAGTAVLNSTVFTKEDADAIVDLVRIAHGRLLKGDAEQIHIIRIGCALNVAAVRAEAIGNSQPMLVSIDAAGKALTEADARLEVHGRYGLSGPGIAQLAAGIDAYEDIVRASTPKQMQDAEKEVVRRLTRKVVMS